MASPLIVEIDGWLVQYADGVTKRANSVLSLGRAPTDLNRALKHVETFYTERCQQPSFQIAPASQPEDLDSILHAHGYGTADPTLILTRRIDRLDSVFTDAEADVSIKGEPCADWLRLWLTVDGRDDGTWSAVAEQILRATPAVYTSVYVDGITVAVGRGALVDDWVGLYCMSVSPDHRGRGHARTILRALLHAGSSRDAQRAFVLALRRTM